MNDPEYEAWLEDRELGPQSEGVYVDAFGVPESGEPEPEAASTEPEIDERLAGIEDREAHFRASASGYQAVHEHCAPETGGCPYKTEAENQADLEAWYAAEEAAAEADAELEAEPW